MHVKKVYGPPGTGKTTELLKILKSELETVRPEQIAYVSFTRTGAYEGRDRAIELFGYDAKELPYFKTLHAIAFSDLGCSRDMMIGTEQIKYLSDKLGFRFSDNPSSGDNQAPDDVYFIADALKKENPKKYQSFIKSLNYKKLQYFDHNYSRYKRITGYRDFSDLVAEFVSKNRPLPVKVAIVDEAQDLTALQWQMVRIAFANAERLYVAGDDDQCLTSFAGADVDQFLALKGEEVVLEHSHRLPQAVQAYAVQIADQIKNRSLKPYNPKDEIGELLHISSPDALPIDNGESWFLLARNRWHQERYTSWLRREGIAYTTKTRSGLFPSIKQSWVDDITLYEGIRSHQRRREEGGRLRLKMPGFVAPWYEALELPQKDTSYLRSFLQRDRHQNCSRITVSTIHAAKGAEADHVALLLDMTKQTHENWQTSRDEELRAYYVGATRSKKSLHLIDPRSAWGFPVLGAV